MSDPTVSRVPRITSAQWWWQVDRAAKSLFELIGRAKRAEHAELDHDCGHRWEIIIRSSLHSSGVVGEVPPRHTDANYWDAQKPVIVRAHNLRDALLVAAYLPLSAWVDDEEFPNA